jgi:PDZ domain-containing secreted protein
VVKNIELENIIKIKDDLINANQKAEQQLEEILEYFKNNKNSETIDLRAKVRGVLIEELNIITELYYSI